MRLGFGENSGKFYVAIDYSPILYLFYLNHTQWHSRKHKNTVV